MFFGWGADGDVQDPSAQEVDKVLQAANIALAAMTLHIDLVGPKGAIQDDGARLVRCVEKTAALDGRFGDNARPVLVWHPAGIQRKALTDRAVFEGLCEGLATACAAAERFGVVIAVEMTRAGSIDGAERFLRVAGPGGILGAQSLRGRSELRARPHPASACGADARPRHRNRPTARTCALPRMARSPITDRRGRGAWIIRLISVRCRSGRMCPYFVFEYYKSRADMLKARDIVRTCL